jgi:hypothetical protein
MSKMDRTLSRTPSDIERKYDLASKKTNLVTFYDESKVVISSYTIKQGDKIKPPIDATWVNSRGVKVTFPYTPTSDTNLYIQESTL